MNQHTLLCVEGKNDALAIQSLLQRHSIFLNIRWKNDDSGEINIAESVEKLLESMHVQIVQRRSQPIGFIVDADLDPANPGQSWRNRWKSIRDRLNQIGFSCPEDPVPSGTILRGSIDGGIPAVVGIWLMPNNSSDGMLEDFLRGLINENDALISLAHTATDQAIRVDRRFPEVHRTKAVIHTWLAWQKKPGQAFGTAIQTQKSFQHDTQLANAFVTWFRELFQISAEGRLPRDMDIQD